MADNSEGFEECLENEQKEGEHKKAIRQLYEGKNWLAAHFVHFEM